MFFAVKKKTAGKDAKAGKLVAVRTWGSDGKIRTPLECTQFANQNQGFRIPDRSDASCENNNNYYWDTHAWLARSVGRKWTLFQAISTGIGLTSPQSSCTESPPTEHAVGNRQRLFSTHASQQRVRKMKNEITWSRNACLFLESVTTVDCNSAIFLSFESEDFFASTLLSSVVSICNISCFPFWPGPTTTDAAIEWTAVIQFSRSVWLDA